MTYTTRANAVRGAIRQGMSLDAIVIAKGDDGRFAIHSAPIDIVHVAPIARPVAFIWDYIATNTPTMTRRDMTRALIGMGINAHTVRTQSYKYSRVLV